MVIGYACIMPRQYLLTTLVEILPMLRIAKEALTFDDVLLVPADSTGSAQYC